MFSIASISGPAAKAAPAQLPSFAASLNLPAGYSIRYRIGTGAWVNVAKGTLIPRGPITIEVLQGATAVLETGAIWGKVGFASGATGVLRITAEGIITYTPAGSANISMQPPTLPPGYRLVFVPPAPKPPVVIAPGSRFAGLAAGTVGSFRLVHGSGPSATESALFHYTWNSNFSTRISVPIGGNVVEAVNLTFSQVLGSVKLVGSIAKVPIGYDNLASLGYQLAWVSPANVHIPITSSAFPGLSKGENAKFVLLGPNGAVSDPFTYAWDTAANVVATFSKIGGIAIAFRDTGGKESITGRRLLDISPEQMTPEQRLAAVRERLRPLLLSSRLNYSFFSFASALIVQYHGAGLPNNPIWNAIAGLPIENDASLLIQAIEPHLNLNGFFVVLSYSGIEDYHEIPDNQPSTMLEVIKFINLTHNKSNVTRAEYKKIFESKFRTVPEAKRQATKAALQHELVRLAQEPGNQQVVKAVKNYSFHDLMSNLFSQNFVSKLVLNPVGELLANPSVRQLLQYLANALPTAFGFPPGHPGTVNARNVLLFQAYFTQGASSSTSQPVGIDSLENSVVTILNAHPELVEGLLEWMMSLLELEGAAGPYVLRNPPPPPPPGAVLSMAGVTSWVPVGDAQWIVPFGEIDATSATVARTLPIGFTGELALENAQKQTVGILKISNWGGKDANGTPATQTATMLTATGGPDPWLRASIVAKVGGGYTIQVSPKSTNSVHLTSVSPAGVATFYFGPRPQIVEGSVTVSSPIWTAMNNQKLSPVGGTFRAPTLLKYSSAIAWLVHENPTPAQLGASIHAHMIAWGLSPVQQEQVKNDAEILLGCSNDQAENVMQRIATDVKNDSGWIWQAGKLKGETKPLQLLLYQMLVIRAAMDGISQSGQILPLAQKPYATNVPMDSSLQGFFYALKSVPMPRNNLGITTDDVIGIGHPTHWIWIFPQPATAFTTYRSLNDGILEYGLTARTGVVYETDDPGAGGVLKDWGSAAAADLELSTVSQYGVMSKETTVTVN